MNDLIWSYLTDMIPLILPLFTIRICFDTIRNFIFYNGV